MDNRKAKADNNPSFKENKFPEQEAIMDADKVAERATSLNEISKQTNQQ